MRKIYFTRQGGGDGGADIRKMAYFEQSIDPFILKVKSYLWHGYNFLAYSTNGKKVNDLVTLIFAYKVAF